MRILLDTTVLLSVLLFPSEQADGMMRYIFEEHHLVLPVQAEEELSAAVRRSFPSKTGVIERMLSDMSFELLPRPEPPGALEGAGSAALEAALREGVDVFVTDDPELQALPIERPEILSPAEFVRRYVIH